MPLGNPVSWSSRVARRRRARVAGFAVMLALGSAAALRVFGAPGPAAAQANVADIPLPGGASERVLFIGAANPAATLVMLAGGDGVVGIDSNGGIGALAGNFLVRTRALWPAQGFAVEILGAPGDEPLTGQRLSPAYAEAIGRAAAFARRQVAAPLWLVGTSNGTIAAANGAARLGNGVAGVVLTSSVTRGSGESVFRADLGAIAVPVLIVANRGDTCPASPPQDAPRLAAALSRSPRTEVVLFDSGDFRSSPCQGFSPHGYFGIEPQVVARIAAWIRASGLR
jgi:hypothetical protein